MRFRAAAVVSLFVLVPLTARADPKACIAASEKGQAARNEGRLASAKLAFAECASDACPAAIRKDCAAQVLEVDEAIPTVVFGAKSGGRDVAAVRVLIDGNLVTESINGRALPFDPGSHVVRFELSGQPPIEKSIILKQGEHNRAVDAEWGAPAPSVFGGSDRLATVVLTGKSEGASPILEVRHSSRWTLACSAPCEQPLALDATYRINGDGVRTSVPFTLQAQPGERLSVGIKEGDDGGKKTAVIVTLTGAGAFVLGALIAVLGAAIPPSKQTYGETPAGSCIKGYRESGVCVYTDWGPTYALLATGGILGGAGLITFVSGLILLATGRTDVTQSKATAALNAGGFAF